MTQTLSDRVVGVLGTADAAAKAGAARAVAADWQAGVVPRDMPRRGKAQSEAGRIALLHALAHIELNAIDLAADILVRFPDAGMPMDFYNDWLTVLDEEAKHFLLLSDRLAAFGAAYGDLPALQRCGPRSGRVRGRLLQGTVKLGQGRRISRPAAAKL